MNRREEYQDERWKARAAEIRELDHHQCVMCGAKDVELHVHHLSYPPPPFHIWEAFDTELVTLCKDCHAKIHQSTKRPKFNESRELFDIETDTKQGDCSRCKYSQQPYLLRETDKHLLEYWGICIECGGTECHFVDTIKCEKCTFLQFCDYGETSLACERYRERRCQFCSHFHEFKNEDDEYIDECTMDGSEIFWGDDCEHCNGQQFVSRVRNNEELREYLKQFD